MQVVLTHCRLCSKLIQFAPEGTWCAECRTTFHRACLTAANQVCPVCQRRAVAPEDGFVFPKACFACGTPVTPPRSTCAACGHTVRYDTREEYERHLSGVKDYAKSCLVAGVAEAVFGFVTLGVAVGLAFSLVFATVGVFHFAVPLVGIGLVSDGFRRIATGRRLGAAE